MPKEKNAHLETILERLEDTTLNTHLSKCNNYQELQSILSSDLSVDIKIYEKLLALCMRDLKEDIQYTTYALAIINTILGKTKNGDFSSLLNLVPSAVLIINNVKSVAPTNKFNALKMLYFETLLSYPDDTLLAVATKHSKDLVEIFDVYCQPQMPLDFKQLALKFLLKLLKTIASKKKDTFVQDYIPVWFSRVFPTIMSLAASNPDFEYVKILELLTDSLVLVDYSQNSQWKTILECIYNPQKYPAIMKNLLEIGSNIWHILWIIFVKLLKNQITQVTDSNGSPINAMLPVVELAFKLDTTNRCRAFQCWDALIDNFSSEANESFAVKRIKLLIIPLKANNARVEETALAKFSTWWHLIRKFHSKIDKFTDVILIPFLHFCFGKPSTSGKKQLIPGHISNNVKRQCVQALVEIAGHVDCEGCVTLPKLKQRLISTSLLADHWNDWVHSLKVAIKIAAGNQIELMVPQQLTCLWKSFVMTIGELPANNIRKDMFNEFMSIIENLLQDCSSENKLAELIFHVLISALFDDENKINHLLNSKDSQPRPIQTILSVILSPTLDNVYRSMDMRKLIIKFKPITDFILSESGNTRDNTVEWLLKHLPANDNALALWTALSESICESSNPLSEQNLCTVLLWPLKSMALFKNAMTSIVWYRWYTLYDSSYLKLKNTSIDNDISKLLIVKSELVPSTVNFILSASLAILKRKLLYKPNGCEGDVDILLNTMTKSQNCESIEEVFPVLVDTLVLMINKVTETVNVTLATQALTAVKIVLKSQVNHLQSNESNKTFFAENLFKPLNALFQIEAYTGLIVILADDLIQCLSVNDKQSNLKTNALTLLKIFMTKMKEGNDDPLYIKIKTAIDAVEGKSDIEKTSDNNTFAAPKETTKKPKKKEPSIVNTVVENGEEYVVVKSNWKFNPRKLTENQKEKLKRKREDIPALYQDLSQSQDEFKLTTWKTDSQDTSTTTSRSASKSADEDVSTILKNMPSSHVVPKIMENFLSESKGTINKVSIDTTNKQQDATSLRTGVKEAKQPRMALKDRVFKNVRNLIEKSNLPKDPRPLSEDLNLTIKDKVPKTPELKAKNTIELTTSAPPKISSERPSRVIKKPRKFDDTEVFPLIRRRRSQNDSPPEVGDIIVNLEHDDKTNTNPKEILIEPSKEVNKSKESEIPSKQLELDKNVMKGIECALVTPTTALSIEVQDKEMQNSQESQKQISQINEGTEKCVSNANISNVVDIANGVDSDISKKEPITPCNEIMPSKENQDVLTPKSISKKKGLDDPKSSVKKKRSRIEKQLSIDMVEGHPFLQGSTEKRATRKNICTNSEKRKTVSDKLNKAKSETKNSSKSDRKVKEKEKITNVSKSDIVTVVESQDKSFESSEDYPMSEDIIESSQDSTLTTISVRSTKKVSKRVPIVRLDKENDLIKYKEPGDTQKLLHDFGADIAPLNDTLPFEQESKEDIELPKNKTVVDENSQIDLTENMDTQPIEDKDCSSDVIIINDMDSTPIVINTEDTCVGPETQEIAEADTQPMEPDSQATSAVNHIEAVQLNIESVVTLEEQHSVMDTVNNSEIENTQEDLTRSVSEPVNASTSNNKKSNTGACSPLNDEGQRKKDFLDNTVEISPIKSMSPLRENKSPSPETSSDYVVIKLTSPVQSNGEPFNEKCDSPEIFTEDKISPDKRDQSPPRTEVSVSNHSPSSSLSLKKNRPQMRSGGRAAQMLGLCAPDKLKEIMNSDRSIENEEPKKSTLLNTPARRNLRILYNSVNDNSDTPIEAENEDSENFLKFKRCVPPADCSPAGPILKRKLVDMADDATISPASKRKRVSFHDPPVSTTITVQKYIEPGGVRSPQSSALKRQERQMRPANMKSPKRLDNVFKLETVLTKAVESFTDDVIATIEDTEMSSIDETPVVEIVTTSELNDTDPICSELLYCNDPIENIATELSSPAMKELFIKELQGKVETIADLAKMTELEVNRLCIKAPKVQVTKKVLNDYALKRASELQNQNEIAKEPETELLNITVPEVQSVDVEVQTNVILATREMQTDTVAVSTVQTETDTVSTMDSSAQTNESGNKTTADIVKSCLNKPDFIEELSLQLEESSINKLAEKISFNSSLDLLMDKMSAARINEVLTRVVEHNTSDSPNDQCTTKQLTIFQEYLCDRFGSNDLILFCSQLLQKIHDKPV